MSLHTTTRIPVDDIYVAKVGKATYVFAYYEWIIISIAEILKPGYVHEYSRANPQTSGVVARRFKEVIEEVTIPFVVTKAILLKCANEFESLVPERNALIHAHPTTDNDGNQVLSFQAKISKPISDMKWSSTAIEQLIQKIDDAAVQAGNILDKLR